MGARDIGPFDNDDAADWLQDLEKTSDTSLIAEALHAIVDAAADEDLEAGDCAIAIAAAEMVAALRGRPLDELPDEAAEWIEAHPDLDAAKLVPMAQKAIRRIRTNSELKELWDDSADAVQWYASLDDTAARLNAPKGTRF
jgi:hypothetical protein